jgi:bifunctional non-homologous end joining protein LigD
MSLLEYRRRRHFTSTPEPSGDAGASRRERRAPRLHFVIQKHRARSLHYDFRLEWNGLLLSWAVPKGPSLDPSVKRLAVRVEDHPLEYRTFEGRIPEGEYGAGTVEIWDDGTWRPEEPNVDAALRRGELKFMLAGRRLKGSWVLVRTRLGVAGGPRQTWLLIRHRDRPAAAPGASRAAEPKGRRLRSRPRPR